MYYPERKLISVIPVSVNIKPAEAILAVHLPTTKSNALMKRTKHLNRPFLIEFDC